MKKTTLALFTTFAIVIGFTAEAKELILSAPITSMNADKNAFPSGITGGRITIHKTQKTAELTLFRPFYCPPGKFCAMVMPAPVVITLPIKSVKVDSNCGAVTYTASEDHRTVDGVLATLTITDNSKFHCPTFAKVAPTFAVYTTQGVRVHEATESSFIAESLVRSYDDLIVSEIQ